MDWAKKVELMRQTLVDTVKFEGAGSAGFAEYFRITLLATDTFHPFNTDSALNSMDEDGLWNMFAESGELITEHFQNPWNHHPGYTAPAKVKFHVGNATERFLDLVDDASK